jgi:Putative zinc-finger
MHCSWIQQRLSAYTEGELTGVARFVTRLHLQVCPSCLRDAESMETAWSPLRLLPRPEPPTTLGTQLRAAISIELAHGNPWQWRMARLKSAMRESMRPMAIRTISGSLSAALLFGLVLPALWTLPVEANDDIPVTYLTKGLVSSPTLEAEDLFRVSEDTDVLVYIDTRGKVYDFQLPEDQRQNVQLRAEIAQSLLLAEFEPATFFGQPVRGRVVITFTTVKG